MAPGNPAPGGAGAPDDPLHVVVVGGHVLVCGAEPADRERAFLASLPAAPDHFLVLLSSEAYTRPRVGAQIRAVLRELLATLPVDDSRTVWLGVDDLGSWATMLDDLVRRSGRTVVAPEGGLLFVTGGGIHVGTVSGGTAWWRFAPDRPPEIAGQRYPAAAWDAALPRERSTLGRSSIEPVLAGLLVRRAGAPAAGPDHPAHCLAPDTGAPALVLDDDDLTADDVVELLAALPPDVADTTLLVSTSPTTTSRPWLARLAATAGRDVVALPGTAVVGVDGLLAAVVVDGSTGLERAPWVSRLRQRPDGGQRVDAVAPAPPGFVRDGHAYRPAGTPDSAVRVDVLPHGARVTAADPERAPEAAPFDPDALVVELGMPDEEVDSSLLETAERFLVAVDDAGLGVGAGIEVRLSGRWNGDLPEVAHRFVADLAPVPRRVPVLPPVAVTATVSAEPVAPEEPAVSSSSIAAALARASSPQEDGAPAGGSAEEAGGDGGEQAGGEAADDSDDAAAAALRPDPDDLQGPAARGRRDRSSARPALTVVDRDSTPAEQRRFAAAAGERFTEALATVNAAFASWPALRGQESAGSKADLAAVCLFLAEGETGSGSVNDAVRDGSAGPVDDQVPCLVSGLRRLPIHRRAVLHQSVQGATHDESALVGRLLREPAFVSVSTALDVTVPDADVDVLIWPVAARRVSELTSNAVDEAVLAAGARFKVLAVRHAESTDETPVPPPTAVLVREIGPGEPAPSGDDLDERDHAALGRLDRALAGRRRGAVREVHDAAVTARLTATMAGLDAPEAVWALEVASSSVAVGA